ncbi:decaprenyl diphosphate synthase subunit 1 qless [Bombus fervidus]|uniref:decaprenyl diphosphate synthase subunit 1 qless n=1 Tax=Bombus fervidus TaxID=203811 RepID=UPI003AB2AAF5
MACIGSSRLCARAEKLCQFRHLTQLRRKVSTTCVKSRPRIENPTSTLVQHCQSRTSTRDCRTNVARMMSSMQTQLPGSLHDYQVDPYRLLEDDLKDVYDNIREVLIRNTTLKELQNIATYYFDGTGKALRPMLITLMARAINYHKERNVLLDSQRQVAMITEMIHNASLMHDDVIDLPTFRRGKPSINVVWNEKKVTMAGDYVLAVASIMIAQLQNNDITLLLSQVVMDLVQGEVMQLGSKETENERFAHYLRKTDLKTASLFINSLKAVTILADGDEQLVEIASEYGRNIGLAFQFVDDCLDFVSSLSALGKPTAADLKIGLATAPVLFACERYPELNAMIMRRFQEPGDVEKAFELVHKSQGLDQTKFLARKHCAEAMKLAQSLAESPYQKGLQVVCDLVLNRIK